MTSTLSLQRTRTLFLTALIALPAAALFSGCSALEGLGGSSSESSDRDRDRERDRSDELNVPPSRTEVSAGVPRTARVAARGTGPVNFRAREDGRVWVLETSTDRVVFEDRVLRGDEVRVDPDRDRVTLNDRAVGDRDLAADSGHKIFFEDRLGGGSLDRDLDREPIRARDRDRY